ncbi:hypothetical protein BH23GEM3_BH23GEM3_18690 [soil metagenome]
MPLATQTKLLRVLEEREFRRVGGENSLRVDVRVLAATNRSLREQVELGEFRRDLDHRLNVLRIEIPPLRERRADIPRLIERFVRQFSVEHDRPFPGIDPEAMRILEDYSWPGNVRELRNLVESMVVLAPGRTIHPEDIPAEVRFGGRGRSLLPVLVPRPSPAGAPRGEGGHPAELDFVLQTLFDMRLDLEELRREFDTFRSRGESVEGLSEYDLARYAPARVYSPARRLSPPPTEPEPASAAEDSPAAVDAADADAIVFREGMTMQELERRAIELALKRFGGNRRKAAEALEIGERTLYRKIKEYGLEA